MPIPVAAFSLDPTVGLAPLVVAFTDESTNAPTEWLWDFGDGQTSAEQDPVHTYTATGSFTVILTATNISGSDDEEKADCLVVVPPGLPKPGPGDTRPLSDVDVSGPNEDYEILPRAGGLASVTVLVAGKADSYVEVYDGPVGVGQLVSHVSGAAAGNRDVVKAWLPYGIHAKIVDDNATLVVRITGHFR